MSREGDTFWVSLSEKFFGLILIVIGALMLYYTATTADLGTFGAFFGVLSVIMLLIGVFLMVVRPPQ
jgi:membrane-bound ClpP family serine protease